TLSTEVRRESRMRDAADCVAPRPMTKSLRTGPPNPHNLTLDAVNPAEHQQHAALTYATHDGVALQGDLYVPKGAGPFPALVAVHGGGWQQGARSAFQYWGPYLAAHGYAMFTISYRLAKKGTKTFPQAVQDVIAAIRYVRANASEYRIDPARIGLFGASAGG